MRSQTRTWRRWIALNAIVVAAILVLAEVFWRALVPAPLGPDRRTFLDASLRYLEPCATVERRAGVRVLRGLHPEQSAGGFAFPIEKPPGVWRIAFVGESTGVMLAGAAEELLADQSEGEGVQVLDCAASGSAFEHVQLRAREVLAYSPDVVVVVFGHNLMMRYPMGRWRLWIEALLSRSRLAAAIMSVAAGSPGGEPDQGERLAQFEAWLRRFSMETRQRGISLVVTTLASNLWYPPAVSAAALSEPRFLTAQLEHANGNTAAAIDDLASLVAQRREAYWEFVLGTWLARRGAHADAAQHLQAAIDVAALEPDRAPSVVNEAIRKVARSEGLVLRDTDAQLRSISRDGLPGWDVMRDHCHLRPRYLTSEAAAVLQLARTAMRRQDDAPTNGHVSDEPDVIGWVFNGLMGIQAQYDDTKAYRHLQAIGYFVEHWLRADPQHMTAAVDALLQGPALSGMEPERRAALLVSIADGYWQAGGRDRALDINERARRETVARPWVQLGLLRLSAGQGTAAIDAFRRAHELSPERSDVAFFLRRTVGGDSQ
jgi:tetratricopeptide (TPR) repeat protein